MRKPSPPSPEATLVPPLDGFAQGELSWSFSVRISPLSCILERGLSLVLVKAGGLILM